MAVGDKVKAKSPDDEQWYPGRIQACNDDGTWMVAWDEPDGGPDYESIKADDIKKIRIFQDYKVGDDCKAISPDDFRWYPGTIAEVLGEGKFRVKWDDPDGGDETADIDAENMKRQRIKRNYKPGAEVLAMFPDDGEMYPATVVSQNEDGSFKVKWDDPDDGPEESDVCPKVMRSPVIPFDQLKVGDKYTGTITELTEWGAFVDVGSEMEAFLHISLISEGALLRRGPLNLDIHHFLENPQEIECWICGLDPVNRKIDVTMIEGMWYSRPDHFRPFEGLDPHQWCEGHVAKIDTLGLDVRVTLESRQQAVGFLRFDNMDSATRYQKGMAIGDRIKVRVTYVNAKEMRMYLSAKKIVDAPKEDFAPFEGIDQSMWLTGTVDRLTSFAAFVKLKSPDSKAVATGILHRTQISDDMIDNIQSHLSLGQEVQVRISTMDLLDGRMALTMQQPEES